MCKTKEEAANCSYKFYSVCPCEAAELEFERCTEACHECNAESGCYLKAETKY